MSEGLGEKGISYDQKLLGGKPVITGTRISVELILSKLAAGRSPEEIIYSHSLSPDAIEVAIRYTESLPVKHPLAQLLQEYRAVRR